MDQEGERGKAAGNIFSAVPVPFRSVGSVPVPVPPSQFQFQFSVQPFSKFPFYEFVIKKRKRKKEPKDFLNKNIFPKEHK